MAVWQLPTWDECEQIGELDRSPLEDFIYHETPAGKDEAVFRDRLWKVIVDGKDRIDAFLAQSPMGAKPTNWFDGGYLDNGHCSFMQAMYGKHYCCRLPHGHDGAHSPNSGEVNHE